ncbi:MAG: hypothetical protein U0805_04960 [Pirellulales bacterium]
MNSDDLTREQAERLKATLLPTLRYLDRLKRRMVNRGFPSNDPLLCDVCGAYEAIQGLRVRLHYLSCDGGVGRPARQMQADEYAQP